MGSQQSPYTPGYPGGYPNQGPQQCPPSGSNCPAVIAYPGYPQQQGGYFTNPGGGYQQPVGGFVSNQPGQISAGYYPQNPQLQPCGPQSQQPYREEDKNDTAGDCAKVCCGCLAGYCLCEALCSMLSCLCQICTD